MAFYYKKFWGIIFIVVMSIYAQSIFFEYTLDDHTLVLDKVAGKINDLNSLDRLTAQLYNNRDYRPISMYVFGLENLIFGEMNPKISHSINIFLFFVILFFANTLFHHIFKFKDSEKLIFYSILLFASHPLCVEVVSSVKSRDGLLSMLFSILSMLFFIKGMDKKRLILYLLGGIFFLLGILSKLDALGVMIFVPIYYLWKFRINKSQLKRVFALVLIFGFFLILFKIFKSNTIDNIDDNSSLGIPNYTENNIFDKKGFHNNVAFASQTNFIYLSKIIFPVNLRYYYGYAHYKLSTFFTMQGIAFVVLNLVLLFIILKFKSDFKKQIYLSLIGYLCLIFYALNFVTAVSGIVADRYVFMALPWFILFVVIIVSEITPHRKKHILTPFFSILVFIFITLSAYRASAWKSDLSLIERDAPHLSKSYEAMRIAANVYKIESDSSKNDNQKRMYLLKALECSKNANRVFPNNTLMNIYEGTYHFALGNKMDALKCFKKSLTVDSTRIDALIYIGDTYYSLNKLDDALMFYQKAFEIQPENLILINNIGTVYYEIGEKNASLNFSKGILEKDSFNLAAWENVGYYYLSEKDTLKAAEIFKEAIKRGLSSEIIPIDID